MPTAHATMSSAITFPGRTMLRHRVQTWILTTGCHRWFSANKFERFGDCPVPVSKQRLVPKSGTYPLGFEVGSVHVGIKPASKSQPDLVSIRSTGPIHLSSAAAVFTKNEFPAASITVSKMLLQSSQGHGVRGVIANSWCANTLTGVSGLEDSAAMAQAAGRCLADGHLDAQHVPTFLVMHTGVGGQRLPMEPILQHIPKLAQNMGVSHEHWLAGAWGLATTDTFPKLLSTTFTLPSYGTNTTFSIAGITKGAGMVFPNMHTTLGIFCTDAPVSARALQRLLSLAADSSYNSISIDGDTSTNDMVALLANGAAAHSSAQRDGAFAGQKEIVQVDWDPSKPDALQSRDYATFQGVLSKFLSEAAQLVVRDAEGASKFITIRIRGCADGKASKRIASVIARSTLVKTGMYGGDPNWGGILAALGYSLVDTQFSGKSIIIPELTSIYFAHSGAPDGYVKFLDRGRPVVVEESQIRKIMASEDVEVVVDLRDKGSSPSLTNGGDESIFWTSDLTHDFVTINSGMNS